MRKRMKLLAVVTYDEAFKSSEIQEKMARDRLKAQLMKNIDTIVDDALLEEKYDISNNGPYKTFTMDVTWPCKEPGGKQ
ncbi:MAG: hypothetical protein RR324_01150 [Cellulosilyticaceae bacterium]